MSVSADSGRAPADTGITQCTLCFESGDFPLGGGEKPGPPLVAQIASLLNARMCKCRWLNNIGHNKEELHDHGVDMIWYDFMLLTKVDCGRSRSD